MAAVEQPPEVVGGVVQHGGEQGTLARELVVEAARRHPGGFEDVTGEARAVVAEPGEGLARGIEDQGSGRLATGCHRPIIATRTFFLEQLL